MVTKSCEIAPFGSHPGKIYRIAKPAWYLIFAALAVFAITPAALAQTGLATITGLVSDPSGAAVAALAVTATNQGTGVSYKGVTNESGNYVITSVPIGTYVVVAIQPGFKRAQSMIPISAAQTARVDFRLEVGGVEQQVEVVATGALLQTESAVVGHELARNEIEQLPVQGRNLSSTTLYTAGATSPNTPGFDSLKGGARPYVSGQREQSNSFTIDGVDANEAIDNNIAYQPSPDAVEQVRVETNNYSPELGNVAGAVVNMVIKSGTNQFHGNGFYYGRDNSLAATDWETNRNGGTKTGYTRHIYGGTLGGPIIRDKLFFFGDYQGGRVNIPPSDAFATVVPDAWRQGDLSSLLPKFVIKDPLTGQPFTNNQIPVTRISTFAQSLFANDSLYPHANVSRPISDFRNNYKGSTSSNESTNQFDVKVDWNASPKDKVYARYSHQWYNNLPRETVMPLSFASKSHGPSWSMGVDWNRTFGTAVVNDLLFGFNRNIIDSIPFDTRNLGPLNSKLGIGGDQAIPLGLSQVQMGNNVTSIGSTAVASNTANKVYQFNERLTWVRGRHTLKFGGSDYYYQEQRYYSANEGQLGYISYTNFSFTGAPFADFLLDQVSGKGRGSLAEAWIHSQHRIAAYAADDLKVTQKLTLNLGLRWAYTSPLIEAHDRQSSFDLTNSALLLAGKDGNSRALYKPYYKGFEPRIGVAYRAGDRWVVRGGYGVTQYEEGTGANNRLPLNPPFFFSSAVRYDSTSGPGSIASGFDGLLALDRPSGQVRAFRGFRPQFTQQWNFFLEYLVGAKSSLDVGYVGSWTSHLAGTIDANQPLPGSGDPATWAPLQQRRPLYPYNPNITTVVTTTSIARSNYNALQATFKQQLWQGVNFVANYAYSKALADSRGFYGSPGVASDSSLSSPQNSYDIKGNYGPAFFDARHVFSLAGGYDLPFGQGRMVGNSWGRALDTIAGGWSASFGILAHSGYPITVWDSSSPSLQATRGTERPDRIGSGKVAQPTIDHWIDRSAFVSAPPGHFGNSGVGILRAPGFWNADFAVTKKITTREKQYLMLRCELFNLFNHPNMGPPDRDIRSATFGTINGVVNAPRIVQLVAKYYF